MSTAERLSLPAPSSRVLSSDGPCRPDDSSAISTLASTPALPSTTDTPRIRKRHLKPPKDTKVYKIAMAYVGLKAQGLKLQEISDTIGVPKDTITTYVKRANKHGWLKRELLGVEDQIELSLPEQIVGNVAAVLSERDGTTLTLTPAAREMTIAAAKGFGIFKNHEAVKVDGVIGVGFALKVQVELPQGISTLSPIQIRPGSVGGTPAIDAEIMGDGEGASS